MFDYTLVAVVKDHAELWHNIGRGYTFTRPEGSPYSSPKMARWCRINLFQDALVADGYLDPNDDHGENQRLTQVLNMLGW